MQTGAAPPQTAQVAPQCCESVAEQGMHAPPLHHWPGPHWPSAVHTHWPFLQTGVGVPVQSMHSKPQWASLVQGVQLPSHQVPTGQDASVHAHLPPSHTGTSPPQGSQAGPQRSAVSHPSQDPPAQALPLSHGWASSHWTQPPALQKPPMGAQLVQDGPHRSSVSQGIHAPPSQTAPAPQLVPVHRQEAMWQTGRSAGQVPHREATSAAGPPSARPPPKGFQAPESEEPASVPGDVPGNVVAVSPQARSAVRANSVGMCHFMGRKGGKRGAPCQGRLRVPALTLTARPAPRRVARVHGRISRVSNLSRSGP